MPIANSAQSNYGYVEKRFQQDGDTLADHRNMGKVQNG